MKSEFLLALTQLASERRLPKELVLKAIESGLVSAFKKSIESPDSKIVITLDQSSGKLSAVRVWTIVETVENPEAELSIEDALKLDKNAQVGGMVKKLAVSDEDSTRIFARMTRQVILQRLREAERELVTQEFSERIGHIISGTVENVEKGRLTVDTGRVFVGVPYDEQVSNERYRKGQRLKIYVSEVRQTIRGPEVICSRASDGLVRKLFEAEVPEIQAGVVSIQEISREAGNRTKIAVTTTDEGIDPVGSCIGVSGSRIQNIVNELQGEKVDVIKWAEDEKVFLENSLSPAEVIEVVFVASKEVIVVVRDEQLSLAIGKEGQNARLAAKLTGLRLDLRSVTEWEKEKTSVLEKLEKRDKEALISEVSETIDIQKEEKIQPKVEKVKETITEKIIDTESIVSNEADLLETEKEPVVENLPTEEQSTISEKPEISEDSSVLSVEKELLALEEEAKVNAIENEQKTDIKEEEIDWDLGLGSASDDSIRFAEDIVQTNNPSNKRGQKKQSRRQNRPGKNRR